MKNVWDIHAITAAALACSCAVGRDKALDRTSAVIEDGKYIRRQVRAVDGA